MVSILVTGAAGVVGKRVVSRLVADESVERVVALDRQSQATIHRSTTDPNHDSAPGVVADENQPLEQRLDVHTVDLISDEIGPLFEGCDSVIHLAEDRGRRSDADVASDVLLRVLAATEAGGCQHFVLLSSALVYGAKPDNPVPITESQPLPLNPQLAHAAIKIRLEGEAQAWAESSNSRLAILRPTATLSETDASWIGVALRAAIAIRPDQIDPPVQFLHHDDLADALVLAALDGLDSVFNVAPDGWIEAEVFRALRGETEIRLPSLLGDIRLRAAKALANRTLLEGLEPYVRCPWVVSNDRLKAMGWQPAYTNEEAYVAGSATPLFSSIGPQRRQEIALGAAGSVGAVALGGVLWLTRRSAR